MMVPPKPTISQGHRVPNAVDFPPVEDSSTSMFGGRPREVGDIRSSDRSSSASGSVIRKTTHRSLNRNNTGPGSSSTNASAFAPKPAWPGTGENPSVTAARLASQISSRESGRSSSAQSDVSRRNGEIVLDDSGPYQMGADETRIITLPLAQPVLRSKISTTPKRLSRQADAISDELLYLPQVQKHPPKAPAGEVLSITKPKNDAESGSGNTDTPEQPIPRAVPAPPTPRRNRGPRRHAPTQVPKRPTLPSVPQHPVQRLERPSLPIAAVQKTETLLPSVPPPTPPRLPTVRSTTSSGPLPRAGISLPRNLTSASSTSLTTMANASAQNHAVLASSIACSRTPPIPPAQPTLNLPSLQRKPKKKPTVAPPPPPPLRRRRSEPSIGGRRGGIRTTMRTPAPPPPRPKPPGTAPRILPTHKHKHKHSASLHPLHLSDTIISEKERKRYEGVWAANSGYLMETLVHILPIPPPLSPSPHNQQQQQPTRDIMLSEGIHPLVAKDIWARSRLPPDTLSGIWKLVDRGTKGWLCREEFVIGMWLIDRCLRGKKLPMGGSLADAVWTSVRRLGV